MQTLFPIFQVGPGSDASSCWVEYVSNHRPTGIIGQSNTEEKKNNRRYRKTVTRYMLCHPINKCTVKVVVVFRAFRVQSTLVYVQ